MNSIPPRQTRRLTGKSLALVLLTSLSALTLAGCVTENSTQGYLLDEESLDAKRYHRMHIHAIRNDEAMSQFGLDTKLDTDWDLMTKLRDLGRETAGRWLEATLSPSLQLLRMVSPLSWMPLAVMPTWSPPFRLIPLKFN